MKSIKNKSVVAASLIVIALIAILTLSVASQVIKYQATVGIPVTSPDLETGIKPTTSPYGRHRRFPTATPTATALPAAAAPTSAPTTAPTLAPTTAATVAPTTGAVLSTSAYYVSTSGNDANPGTLAAPWRTIAKAAQKMTAGAVVYVRGGVYNEQVSIAQSGTAAAPIKLMAYPGETPVVDASPLTMATWSALFSISGNYVQVSGFEVRNSKYMGVVIKGKYDVVDNFYSHHNQQNGILIAGDYGTVQNSRVYRNCLSNEYGKAGSWASGLSAARDATDGITDYAVIRNNTVWENWGEGVSSYEANGTLIQGNVSHDNYTANIYISDSTNVTAQGNMVYMTPGDYVVGSNVGIMMGDEVYTPPSANIQVINNIAYGNRRNFYWWQGTKGGGMNNVLIANNTFVNSTYTAGVQINQGTHQNVTFTDNIIQQDGSLPPIALGATSGITFSRNDWSKTPASGALGANSLVGDPKLSKSGSPYAGDWYRLLDGSPAINQASSLSQVTVDFFNQPRGTVPDMGSIEK